MIGKLIVAAILVSCVSSSARVTHAASPPEPSAPPAPACEVGKNDYYEKQFAPPKPSPSPGAQSNGQAQCLDPGTQVSSQEGDISGVAAKTAAKTAEIDASLVPPECIRAVMGRRPNPTKNYLYAKCESDSSVATIKDVLPPCLSDNYVNFTRGAFIGALQCLGEDPREYFGLFGCESAFQLNIGNLSHAWGIGQITPAAGAPKLFGGWFDPYRDKPECAEYAETMKLEAISKTTPCLLARPPANPARTVLFAGLLFKRLKKEAAGLIPRKVAAAERQRMIRELAMEMYNAGSSGVSACWRNYLADHPDGAESYAKFSGGFPGYLAGHYGDGIPYFEKNTGTRDAIRSQVSTYVAHVRSTTDFANAAARKRCGI